MTKITIKQLVDEDFVNFKVPSMFIGFPHCTFKCGRELCQNSALAKSNDIIVEENELVKRYLSNPITEAVVIGGLEPFDDMEQLVGLITNFRKHTDAPIIIFTGYNRDEITDSMKRVAEGGNIIVKFGRYMSGQNPHYDPVLGVKLASDNQYAEQIS